MMGGVNSNKAHLQTLTKFIRKPKPVLARDTQLTGTRNSLHNAMMVFRKQQEILNETTKNLMDGSASKATLDMQAHRQKELINCYAVQSPSQRSYN